VSRFRRAAWLAREGHYGALLRRLRIRLWRDYLAFGLEYDLRVPVRAGVPRLPVEVRPIKPEDVPIFVALPPAEGPRADAILRANARHLLQSGLQTCYVGVTDEGPVYMQFLVTPDQNDRLATVFGELFPPLMEDEGLLEFAYTLKEHRTRPVMPSVLVRLLEIAAGNGLTRVVTYVPARHVNFVRFFLRLGFVPFAARIEKYRFLRRKVEFRPLDRNLAEPLSAPAGIEAVMVSILH
jgi:hypothetical protein